MYPLTKAENGKSYTIKWLFGRPEVMSYFAAIPIGVGSRLKVLMNFGDYLLIGFGDRRFILESEVADRIQVGA